MGWVEKGEVVPEQKAPTGLVNPRRHSSEVDFCVNSKGYVRVLIKKIINNILFLIFASITLDLPVLLVFVTSGGLCSPPHPTFPAIYLGNC